MNDTETKSTPYMGIDPDTGKPAAFYRNSEGRFTTNTTDNTWTYHPESHYWTKGKSRIVLTASGRFRPCIDENTESLYSYATFEEAVKHMTSKTPYEDRSATWDSLPSIFRDVVKTCPDGRFRIVETEKTFPTIRDLMLHLTTQWMVGFVANETTFLLQTPCIRLKVFRSVGRYHIVGWRLEKTVDESHETLDAAIETCTKYAVELVGHWFPA